ncbi:MAG: hypothetical protein RL189_419 [Pseudomonadota bacterium]|jgi:ribosomal protein RSM22 (predicted rRNA methylase)
MSAAFINIKFNPPATEQCAINSRSLSLNQEKSWWNQESGAEVISGPLLLGQLEKTIFTQSPPAPAQLQSVSDLTRELWSHFNTDRSMLDRDYMSDEKMLNAYLASFFLPNIERTRAVASRPRVLDALRDIAKLDSINIIDFGAGPLSASIGFLFAINQFRTLNSPRHSPAMRVHITAVERSERAVRKGESLLKSSLTGNIQVEVARTTSIPKDGKFQVILAANIFNEIPEKHRQKTFESLMSTLDSASANLALVIEPGQEQHSRNLAGMRDNILTQSVFRGLRVIAPCPHQSPCPLSSAANRNDWCWFKTFFKRPPLLLEIDRRSRIEHSELAFSFLAVSSSLRNSNKIPWGVCVSDEMPVGEESDKPKRLNYFRNNLLKSLESPPIQVLENLAAMGVKTKICGPSGAYLAGLRVKTQESRPFERGQELDSADPFAAVISER